MKISKKEAMEIAETAASIQGFGTLCLTGYHTVWKSDTDDDDVAIDICKKKDDDGVEYYSVYVSPLYDDCDYRYTKSLDTNELCNLILEIVQDQMKVAKEVSA